MPDKLPAVTIGIPFYNAERFLLNAIKSVFAQTHQNWELILVDDGSSDRSLEIAKSIKDPRVRVYSDGKNKKLAFRLNQIRDLAQYDFIARMDADDLMATNRIEKQLKFLLDRPDLDLVTTGVCSISDDSEPYGIRLPGKSVDLTPYMVLKGAHGIVHASIIGRKEWFYRNPYDPEDGRAQDYKLWVRSIKRNDLSVGFLSEPLYFYREEGSASLSKMLTGKRVGRTVLLDTGIELIGVSKTLKLLSRNMVKTALMIAFSALGLTNYLASRRSPVVDSEMFDWVSREIRRISSVIFRIDS